MGTESGDVSVCDGTYYSRDEGYVCVGYKEREREARKKLPL